MLSLTAAAAEKKKKKEHSTAIRETRCVPIAAHVMSRRCLV